MICLKLKLKEEISATCVGDHVVTLQLKISKRSGRTTDLVNETLQTTELNSANMFIADDSGVSVSNEVSLSFSGYRDIETICASVPYVGINAEISSNDRKPILQRKKKIF